MDYKRMYWFQLVYIGFMFIFIVGMTCNFLAVVGNNGKMPVYSFYANDDKHFGYSDNNEINHPYLTDKLRVIPNYICSIGDLIMIFAVLGMFVTVFINTCTRWGSYKR
jgi:hypothetical protein